MYSNSFQFFSRSLCIAMRCLLLSQEFEGIVVLSNSGFGVGYCLGESKPASARYFGLSRMIQICLGTNQKKRKGKECYFGATMFITFLFHLKARTATVMMEAVHNSISNVSGVTSVGIVSSPRDGSCSNVLSPKYG